MAGVKAKIIPPEIYEFFLLNVVVCRRSLAVEYLGKSPLCMKQFYAILSSSRIPGKKRDDIVTFSPDKPNPPSHIIIAHNNHVSQIY